MLKRTIKYVDLNGERRADDCYFDLNEAELVEMEFSKSGGLSSFLREVVNAQDLTTLSTLLKDLIIRSYGEKSPDGKYFIKGDNFEKGKLFVQSRAYPVFYMQLITTDGALAQFCNELVPETLSKRAADMKQVLDAEEKTRMENAISFSGIPSAEEISSN